MEATASNDKGPRRVFGVTAATKFDSTLHPRGKDGKFIEKGGFVSWLMPDGTKKKGKVTNIEADGITVQTADGSAEKVQADQLSQAAEVKARLDAPAAPDANLDTASAETTGTGTKEDPFVTSDIEFAAQALGDDKYVQLNQPDEVATLLDELAKVSKEFAAKGENTKGKFDLCHVTVPGTNVFCAESKVPDRKKMPQLGGVPSPGSKADQLPKDDNGEVNLAPQFVDHLASLGISVTDGQKDASHLRASQGQLDGSTVAGMMTSDTYDPGAEPIFITRDGYVVDGHHRWAAVTGRSYREGEPLPMNVRVIDADIMQTLELANSFAADMGMAQRGLGENNTPDAKPELDGTLKPAPNMSIGMDGIDDVVERMNTGKLTRQQAQAELEDAIKIPNNEDFGEYQKQWDATSEQISLMLDKSLRRDPTDAEINQSIKDHPELNGTSAPPPPKETPEAMRARVHAQRDQQTAELAKTLDTPENAAKRERLAGNVERFDEALAGDHAGMTVQEVNAIRFPEGNSDGDVFEGIKIPPNMISGLFDGATFHPDVLAEFRSAAADSGNPEAAAAADKLAANAKVLTDLDRPDVTSMDDHALQEEMIDLTTVGRTNWPARRAIVMAERDKRQAAERTERDKTAPPAPAPPPPVGRGASSDVFGDDDRLELNMNEDRLDGVVGDFERGDITREQAEDDLINDMKIDLPEDSDEWEAAYSDGVDAVARFFDELERRLEAMTEEERAALQSSGFTAAFGRHKFNADLHPRGQDGKFIETGGFVKWLSSTGDREHRGTVLGVNPENGLVKIKAASGDETELNANRLVSVATPKASLNEPSVAMPAYELSVPELAPAFPNDSPSSYQTYLDSLTPEELAMEELRARVHRRQLVAASAAPDELRTRVHGMAAAGKFDALKHPRGRDGKFITVGGFVKWMIGGETRVGKVLSIGKDGKIAVSPRSDDPDGPVGTVYMRPDQLSKAPTPKGSLKGKPAPAAKVAKKPDAGGDPTGESLSDEERTQALESLSDSFGPGVLFSTGVGGELEWVPEADMGGVAEAYATEDDYEEEDDDLSAADALDILVESGWEPLMSGTADEVRELLSGSPEPHRGSDEDTIVEEDLGPGAPPGPGFEEVSDDAMWEVLYTLFDAPPGSRDVPRINEVMTEIESRHLSEPATMSPERKAKAEAKQAAYEKANPLPMTSKAPIAYDYKPVDVDAEILPLFEGTADQQTQRIADLRDSDIEAFDRLRSHIQDQIENGDSGIAADIDYPWLNDLFDTAEFGPTGTVSGDETPVTKKPRDGDQVEGADHGPGKIVDMSPDGDLVHVDFEDGTSGSYEIVSEGEYINADTDEVLRVGQLPDDEHISDYTVDDAVTPTLSRPDPNPMWVNKTPDEVFAFVEDMRVNTSKATPEQTAALDQANEYLSGLTDTNPAPDFYALAAKGESGDDGWLENVGDALSNMSSPPSVGLDSGSTPPDDLESEQSAYTDENGNMLFENEDVGMDLSGSGIDDLVMEWSDGNISRTDIEDELIDNMIIGLDEDDPTWEATYEDGVSAISAWLDRVFADLDMSTE